MSNTTYQPLISIITSTYQASQFLPKTIASIKNQKFKNFEWIVVDGGSTDGTVEVISQNDTVINKWISEKDSGIYNAWNKAVKMAKGEWFIFIGAGDKLYSETTLLEASKFLNSAFPKYELVYGDIILVSETEEQEIEKISRPWASIKNKWDGLRPMLPVHPEVFHHRTLFENDDMPFPEQFKIVSDSYVLLKSIQKKEPLHIPVTIDIMPIGGVSANIGSAKKMMGEIVQLNKMLGIKPPFYIRIFEIIKTSAKSMMVSMFPKKVQNCLADIYRVIVGKPKKWTLK